MRNRMSKPTTSWPFLAVLLLVTVGCGTTASPAPTSTAVPMAVQMATVQPWLAPTPVPPYEAWGIPPCDGFELLPSSFSFNWPGLDSIKNADNWDYVRCSKRPGEIASFYRSKMTQPPYSWQELGWVELPEGTLGVYFDAVRQGWLYLWMLPRLGSGEASQMVVARTAADAPLDLPCCR